MTTESVESTFNLEKCAVVLLDVAGTISSLSYVKNTLFAYVIKSAPEYLKAHWEDEDVKKAVKDLDEAEVVDSEKAAGIVKDLTEKNSDNKGLKVLQGLIAKQGYESKDLKAHVFADVPSSLESWAKNKKIAIYSTGSVESQKQFFAHTSEGDLSSHVSHYFDQETGSKTEAASYKKIAEELKVKPEELVFMTDDVTEAKAAKEAGVVPVLVSREGNAEISEEDAKLFNVVKSFSEVAVESSQKRKNEEANVEEPPSKLPKKDDDKVEEAKEVIESEKAEVAEEAMEVDSAAKKTEEPEEKKTEAMETETKPVEQKTAEEPKPVEKTEETKETVETKKDAEEKVEKKEVVAEKTEEKNVEEKEAVNGEELKESSVDEEKKVEENKEVVEEKKEVAEEKKEEIAEEKKEEVTTKNGEVKESNGDATEVVDGKKNDEKELANGSEEKKSEKVESDKVESKKEESDKVETEKVETEKVELTEDEIKAKKAEEVKKIDEAAPVEV